MSHIGIKYLGLVLCLSSNVLADNSVERQPCPNRLKLVISGQVDKAARWADNGRHSDLQYVDNDNASSRININGYGMFTSDLRIGAVYEVEMLQNSTRYTDIHNSSNRDASFTSRKAEVYGESKKFGSLYLGLGYTASYLTLAATDLSKTIVILYGSRTNLPAEGITFFDKTTNHLAVGLPGTNNTLKVVDVFDDCDGLGFKDRVRYNSPSWNGLTIEASHSYLTNNDVWDAALKYAATLDTTQIASQASYVQDNTVPIFNRNGTKTSTIGYKQVNGSLGILLPSGISFLVAFAGRHWKKFSQAPEGRLQFGKIGYQLDYFEAGTTAFAIDYGNYNNFVIDTSTRSSIHQKHLGKTVGAGIVQFFSRIGTEVYVGVRRYSVKVKGGDQYYPIKVIMTGARIKL